MHLPESDKSWDAMHRALGDGKLDGETGPYPLSHVVLGGQQLYDGDDYILVLKDPKMLHDIAQALASVTKERLRAGYDAMDTKAYGFEPSDEDFEYTWGGLRTCGRCITQPTGWGDTSCFRWISKRLQARPLPTWNRGPDGATKRRLQVPVFGRKSGGHRGSVVV